MNNATNNTGICGNCDGTGFLAHYAHHANGVCFTCHGTGRVPEGAPVAAPVYTLEDIRRTFAAFRRDFKSAGYDVHYRTDTLSTQLFQVGNKDADLVRKVLAAIAEVDRQSARQVARGLTEWRKFRQMSRAAQEVALEVQGPWCHPVATPWAWGKTQQEAMTTWDWATE